MDSTINNMVVIINDIGPASTDNLYKARTQTKDGEEWLLKSTLQRVDKSGVGCLGLEGAVEEERVGGRAPGVFVGNTPDLTRQILATTICGSLSPDAEGTYCDTDALGHLQASI